MPEYNNRYDIEGCINHGENADKLYFPNFYEIKQFLITSGVTEKNCFMMEFLWEAQERVVGTLILVQMPWI